MPDPIIVDFQGNEADLIASAKKVQAEMDRVSAKLKDSGVSQTAYNKAVAASKPAIVEQTAAVKQASISITDFRSAYMIAMDVVRVGKQAWDETAGATIEYANQVRELSTVSGQTTEETSRFILVLDDYKISAEDAMVATKALTKEGHAPSIETLAKLSDQYLKLNSVEDKNAFVIKNLGKGGLEWVEVLNKGSDAIRKQGAAVSDGLILSQKQVDAARANEIVMDNLNDSVQKLKISIGNQLIPVMTSFVNDLNASTRAQEILGDEYNATVIGTKKWNDALAQAKEEQKQATEAMLKNKDAAGDMADGLKDAAAAEQDAKKAAQDLSSELTGLLSSMFSINSENENYTKTLDDLAVKSSDLAAEKNRLTLAMWEEQRAGKLTNDEYLNYVKNLDDLTKKQEENAKATADAGEEHKKAANQRVYDLVQTKLASDGVTTSGEYEYLQNLAVQKGLVSRASADQAIAENAAADALVANLAKTQTPMEKTLSTMQAIAGYNGTVVNFGVNYTTTGRAPGTGATPTPVRHGGQVMDSGGQGYSGQPYMIGTGAQPEMYVPQTNGRFIPNADKLGNTYNIVVNNPKKETAENSIRRELKSMSYVGGGTPGHQ